MSLGNIQRVVIKLGKNKYFVFSLQEFCTFTPTAMNRWIRKAVVLMQAPKEGCTELLTFFCITSSVDFTFLLTPVVGLQLSPAIQKHNYRELQPQRAQEASFC